MTIVKTYHRIFSTFWKELFLKAHKEIDKCQWVHFQTKFPTKLWLRNNKSLFVYLSIHLSVWPFPLKPSLVFFVFQKVLKSSIVKYYACIVKKFIESVVILGFDKHAIKLVLAVIYMDWQWDELYTDIMAITKLNGYLMNLEKRVWYGSACMMVVYHSLSWIILSVDHHPLVWVTKVWRWRKGAIKKSHLKMTWMEWL